MNLFKKEKSYSVILEELNKKNLPLPYKLDEDGKEVKSIHGYRIRKLSDEKGFGNIKNANSLYFVIDGKGNAVDIFNKDEKKEKELFYQEIAESNFQKAKIKDEDEQFVLKRAKEYRALKRSEREKLEVLKTDDEKNFERFNMAKQRYLDILAKIDKESQKKELDGGMGLPYSELSQQEVAELKRNNTTVKGLFNKMESSERNLLKVSRALTQISGEDYRSKAYNLMESTLPGVTDVPVHKDLLKLQEKKPDERPWYKRMVSSKEPETSVDPEELYRVEKTGSYFKEGEDIVGGAETGGPGWEKVDYDPYGKSKEQKELSEDELLDILVREKKKK